VYGTVTIHAASFAIGLISAAAILNAIAVSPILPDREEHVDRSWIVSARAMLTNAQNLLTQIMNWHEPPTMPAAPEQV